MEPKIVILIRISIDHFEPEENPPKLEDFNEALEHLADAVFFRIQEIKLHAAATNLVTMGHRNNADAQEERTTGACFRDPKDANEDFPG